MLKIRMSYLYVPLEHCDFMPSTVVTGEQYAGMAAATYSDKLPQTQLCGNQYLDITFSPESSVASAPLPTIHDHLPAICGVLTISEHDGDGGAYIEQTRVLAVPEIPSRAQRILSKFHLAPHWMGYREDPVKVRFLDVGSQD